MGQSSTQSKSNTSQRDQQVTLTDASVRDLGTGEGNTFFDFGSFAAIASQALAPVGADGPLFNRSGGESASFEDNRALDLLINVDDGSENALAFAADATRDVYEVIGNVAVSAESLFDRSAYLAEESLRINAELAAATIDNVVDISGRATADAIGAQADAFAGILDALQDSNDNVVSIESARTTGFTDTQVNAFVTVAGLAAAAIILPQVLRKAA